MSQLKTLLRTIYFLVATILNAQQNIPSKWSTNFANPVGINGTVINDIFVDSTGNVHVVGLFATAGTERGSNYARWDGSKWQSVTDEILGTPSTILIDGTDIYIGGNFVETIDGGGQHCIARWDGTEWKTVKYSYEAINVLRMDENRTIYAGGKQHPDYLLQKDGDLWNTVPGISETIIPGPVNDICFDQGNIYVTGRNGTSGYFSGRINGVWQTLGSMNAPGNTITKYRGSIIVGGAFTWASGGQFSGIVRWNGINFSAIAGFEAFSSIEELVSVGENDLYAVGWFKVATANGFTENFAKWDGEHWIGMAKENENLSSMFSDLAQWNGVLFVGGTFERIGNIPASKIAKLQDGVVHPLEINAQGVTGEILAMEKDSIGNIYAGCYSRVRFGSLVTNGIAKWNGTNWDSLNSGVDVAEAITFGKQNDLFVGGCHRAGSIMVNGIARWDGSKWDSLGSGVRQVSGEYGYVRSMAVAPNGDLYVAGYFRYAGDVIANNIARWDGSNWHSVLGGSPVMVNQIVITKGGEIVVGLASPGGGVYRLTEVGWVPMNGVGNWLIDCLTVSGDDVYLTGALSMGVYNFNGTDLIKIASVPHNGMYTNLVYDIALTDQDIYITGDFIQIDEKSIWSAAHCNETGWTPLAGGLDHLRNGSHQGNSIVATEKGIYIGGRFTSAGGVPSSNIAFLPSSALSVQKTTKQEKTIVVRNFPNPFNGMTTISYSIPKDGEIDIIVYDALGREVKTLINEFKRAGQYTAAFDASTLSSGMYFYKIISGSHAVVKKMVLVK